MEFHASRLRRGEVLAGAGAVLLVVFLLVGDWAGSRSGWEVLVSLRWLLALTIAAAFGLVLVQATRRAPAVPVTMSLFVTVLGAISVLAIVYRVLISPPAHEHAAAYLGLLSGIGLAYGGYESMRKEGIAARDAPQEIPVVRPRRENGS